MSTDYTLRMINGLPTSEAIAGDSRFANVYLSMRIRRGAWWAAPAFGARTLGGKQTDVVVGLARARIAESLRWLVGSGRATDVQVHVERDSQYMRMHCRVRVKWRDASEETYQSWVEVV